MLQNSIVQRFAVFFLASLSFACLLGQMWNWWPMQGFACFVLAPATASLIFMALRAPKESLLRMWIVEGALGGIVAAIIYDLFRLPFVLAGYPLFAVFPRFGQLLLNAPQNDFSASVQIVGWAYHFSNGAALGIMLLAMLPRLTRRSVLVGATVWALAVETILLLSPYYGFFKLKMDSGTFLVLTLCAHIVFGLSLGVWLQRRLITKKYA